jgi:hypothetical protein
MLTMILHWHDVIINLKFDIARRSEYGYAAETTGWINCQLILNLFANDGKMTCSAKQGLLKLVKEATPV